MDEKITNAEKDSKLALAIANEVSAGWRVESQSSIQAVMAKGKAINHTLHIIFSVLTLGTWLVIYIPIYLVNRRKVKIIRVDDYGNTLFQ
jgi:hypothetical protein